MDGLTKTVRFISIKLVFEVSQLYKLYVYHVIIIAQSFDNHRFRSKFSFHLRVLEKSLESNDDAIRFQHNILSTGRWPLRACRLYFERHVLYLFHRFFLRKLGKTTVICRKRLPK